MRDTPAHADRIAIRFGPTTDRTVTTMDLRDSPHLGSAGGVDPTSSPARPFLIAALSVIAIGALAWFAFQHSGEAPSGAPAPVKPLALPADDGAMRQAAGTISGDAGTSAVTKPAGSEAPMASAPPTAAADRTEPATNLKMDTEFASAKRIVPFAFNKVGVGPRGALAIKELAPLAKQAQKVYVRGRTDGLGTTESNRKVALDRAFTVYYAFLRAGVDKPKLRLSYCSTCFVAPNDTDAGRRLNRRVEVELVMPPDEIAKLPTPVHAPEAPPPLIAPLASSEILQSVPR